MKIHDYIDLIKKNKIPPEPPSNLMQMGLGGRDNRNFCITKGLWTIIDQIWTGELAKFIENQKCLEIMAGGGWLSKALHQHGIDIIATDNFSWEETHKNMNLVYNVEKIDAINAIFNLIQKSPSFREGFMTFLI